MIAIERPSDDGPVRVRLERPPVNALDLELVRGITAAIAQAVDERAPAVVVTGDGSCFSAGIDTKAVTTYTDDQRREAIAAINAMVSTIYSAPVATVAAVNGHALGGGLVLALACDLRVAATGDYRLALNEAAAGVPFPAGPLAVVRAELDPSVARYLCLTSRIVGPAEALRLRVVDEVVEPDELLERASALAAELASQPAYAVVKRQMRGGVAVQLQHVAETNDDPLLSASA